MSTILFDFEAAKDKALVTVPRLFAKHGQQVVSTEVATAVSKRAGVAFRSVGLTFADGQTVILNVKTTGDVFEVKVNGSVVPIKSQTDQGEAVREIGAWLDKKRAAFQRALARTRTPVPPSIRASVSNSLKAKVTRRDSLKEAIGLAREELDRLTQAE